jgi:hypothetical protein
MFLNGKTHLGWIDGVNYHLANVKSSLNGYFLNEIWKWHVPRNTWTSLFLLPIECFATFEGFGYIMFNI